MGAWYWIGVAAGFGVGIGVFLVAVAGASAARAVAAATVAAALGVLVGLALGDWGEAAGGGVGGVAGATGTSGLLAGALRTGGTRLGTAAILSVGAAALAALALVPGLGYLEVVAVPALGRRLRRRTPERYAGLRTLARR